jgi:hypothetical protein
MPFRIFKELLDDGPAYHLRYVELNEFGQVVAWQPEPVFTVEKRNDVVALLDEMRHAVVEPTIDEDVLWDEGFLWGGQHDD